MLGLGQLAIAVAAAAAAVGAERGQGPLRRLCLEGAVVDGAVAVAAAAAAAAENIGTDADHSVTP